MGVLAGCGFLSGFCVLFLISFLFVVIPPIFVVFIIVAKGVGAIASHQHCQTGLAAYTGKAFDAVAFGILHEVELIIEKVVVLERYSTLLMHHQRDRTMHAADPIG